MAVCSVSGSGCENDLCTAEALRTGVVVGWAIEEGLPEKVTLSQVFVAELQNRRNFPRGAGRALGMRERA